MQIRQAGLDSREREGQWHFLLWHRPANSRTGSLRSPKARTSTSTSAADIEAPRGNAPARLKRGLIGGMIRTMPDRTTKITFAEMRDGGVRRDAGVLRGLIVMTGDPTQDEDSIQAGDGCHTQSPQF